MGKSLRQMYEMKSGLSRLGPGDALESNTEEISLVSSSLQKLTSALKAAQTQGTAAYGGLSRSVQEWSDIAVKATTQAVALLTRQNLLESGSVAAHNQAERTKSLASISSLKQLAPVQAAVQVAKALGDLGDLNFWGAAQHFSSAAMWGTVGATQVAGLIGGGGGSARRSTGSGHSGGEVGSSSGSSMDAGGLAAGAGSARSGPSGSLTVAIMGDNEAGEWLAQTLNTAVEQRGVQLTATRSTQSPYAQG